MSTLEHVNNSAESGSLFRKATIMGVTGTIVRNTIYLTVGDKIGYALQFVFFLYFAKKYGVVPVGEYSFAFVFAYAFACFSDLGATVYLLREVARGKSADRQLFVDCFVLRAVSLLIVSLIAAGIVLATLGDSSDQRLTLIIYWGMYWIFYYLADLTLAEMNGHGKMGWVALLGIWLKLMSAAAGFYMIYAGLDYDTVMIAFPASSFIYLCTCLAVSVRVVGPVQFAFRSFAYYKNLLGVLIPFFFSVLLIELLSSEDVLILGYLKNDQSVGIYSSALKVVTFISGVSTFITVSILPVLSRLWVESRDKLIAASRKILRYLILSGIPISAGLAMIAKRVIELLYPQSFQDATIVLQIASWSLAAAFIQIIYAALLTAMDRQKLKVIACGITLAVTTILYLLCIHQFDYLGAAIVKVVAAFTGLICFAVFVEKHLMHLPLLRYLVRPVIAGLVMMGFLYLFRQWNLVLLVPAAGAVYVMCIFFSGELTRDEVNYFKKFVPGHLYGGE